MKIARVKTPQEYSAGSELYFAYLFLYLCVNGPVSLFASGGHVSSFFI